MSQKTQGLHFFHLWNHGVEWNSFHIPSQCYRYLTLRSSGAEISLKKHLTRWEPTAWMIVSVIQINSLVAGDLKRPKPEKTLQSTQPSPHAMPFPSTYRQAASCKLQPCWTQLDMKESCHTEDVKDLNAPQGISGRTYQKHRVPGPSPGQQNQNLHQNTSGVLVCILGFKLWCLRDPLTILNSVLPADFSRTSFAKAIYGFSFALILRLEALILTVPLFLQGLLICLWRVTQACTGYESTTSPNIILHSVWLCIGPWFSKLKVFDEVSITLQ